MLLPALRLRSIADPVSGLALGASFIAVLGFTTSVLTTCYEYANSVRGSKESILRLIQKLRHLRSLLEQLQDIDIGSETSLKSTQDLLKPEGPLAQCRVELHKLEAKLPTPNPGRVKLVTNKFIWPLKEKDVEQILISIDRYMKAFTVALEIDQM